MVLNMPAVFPQVHGDHIGPRQQGLLTQIHRIGVGGVTGLADGGHMIDIDAKADFMHEDML